MLKMATQQAKNADALNHASHAMPLTAANKPVEVLLPVSRPWGFIMIRTLLFLCLVGVIGIGLYVYTPNLTTKTIPLANLSVTGEDNAVTGLVIQGTDQYGKPFVVRAQSAHAPTLDADVFLERVQADLTVSQSYAISLVSDQAILNQKEQTLKLMGNVVLVKQQETFKLKDLLIDLKTQQATSFSGVNAILPMGNIMADGLRISEKGKVITFEGKSEFIRKPTDGREPKASTQP